MINSILKIGEYMLDYDPSQCYPIRHDVERDIKNARRKKGKEVLEPKIIKIIFDLDAGVIDIDSIKLSSHREEEYLWIGNAKGQKTQLFLTTDNMEKYLLDSSNRNKWGIGSILNEIEKGQLHKKHASIEILYNYLREIVNKFFKNKINVSDVVKQLMLDSHIDKKEVGLYTVSVRENGNAIDLVKTDGYRKFIYYILYEKGRKTLGKCHICNEDKEVFINPAFPGGSFLVIYNLDKKGFLSGLSESDQNLLRTYAICRDCRMKLIIGWNKVENTLRTYLGGFNVYIIPRFLAIVDNPRIFPKFLPQLTKSFDMIKKYSEIKEIDDKFRLLMSYEDIKPITYQINIIFGRGQKNTFNYYGYIQDVPLTRIREIAMLSSSITNKMVSILNKSRDYWSIGIDDIYKIFPLRKTQNWMEWHPFIELIKAILSQTHYPKEELISRAVLLAKIHRYGNYEGYNISKTGERARESELCRGIIKFNMFLNLLSKLKVIDLSSESDTNIRLDDRVLEEFLRIQEYNEWQTSLFLLGTLVADIGSAQYNKGDEKKSVLNKLNYNGMNIEEIKTLVVYMIKGLRDYRILDYRREKLYAIMKQLLDRNIKKLNNDVDNLFYILSGYSFRTLQIITKGGKIE